MTGAAPLIIGHRGASHDAPENTLASFRLAFEQGADGIEADFRLTRDLRVVCMHDSTTARTADRKLVVAEATLEELRQLDIGAWKGERWAGERIPTLEEVLALVPTGAMFFIEIKSGAEILPHLRAILERMDNDPDRIRLLTFDAGLAGELAALLPGIRVCLNVEYAWHARLYGRRPSPGELCEAMPQGGLAGLSSRAGAFLDRQLADAVHRSGRELHVWTVDTVRQARRYHALGVDSIFTNRPWLLKQGL